MGCSVSGKCPQNIPPELTELPKTPTNNQAPTNLPTNGTQKIPPTNNQAPNPDQVSFNGGGNRLNVTA